MFFVRFGQHLSSGDVAVATIGGKNIVKRIFYLSDAEIILQSLSSMIEPIRVDLNTEGFRILGKIIGFQSLI